MSFFQCAVLVEVEQVDVEDGEIFGLQLTLLGFEQLILAVKKFYDVLEVLFELLLQKVIALLGTFCRDLGTLELHLIVVCLKPIVFYGAVELRLLVSQIELIILFGRMALLIAVFV